MEITLKKITAISGLVSYNILIDRMFYDKFNTETEAQTCYDELKRNHELGLPKEETIKHETI